MNGSPCHARNQTGYCGNDSEKKSAGDSDEIPIRAEADVETAIRRTHELTAEAGFDHTSVCMIGTVMSELARNILYHAGCGQVSVRILDFTRRGIEIRAEDKGPGIADIGLALLDNYSTRGGLGIGLPAVNRIMDDMDIRSTPKQGTTIVARKWLD